MSNTVFNGVIRLRKDTEANYELIKNSFVPADGEVCIVEYGDQLKFKVGDGLHYFGSLSYLDEQNPTVIHGYYLNDKFYTDSTYTSEIEKNSGILYIDKIVPGNMYTWDGTKYNFCVPQATENLAGIMKLYQSSGSNTDGAMSQKAVTDGVQSIGFALDSEDTDCLIVDLPWDNVEGYYPTKDAENA